MSPFLKAYVLYCDNYDKAVLRINQLRSFNTAFRKLLDQFKKADKRKLGIFGYLITPIQRIPRYQMLLETLRKYTLKDHVDYEPLSKAIDNVKDVANYVNESVSDYENRAKVIQIHNLFIDLGYDRTSECAIVEPSRR